MQRTGLAAADKRHFLGCVHFRVAQSKAVRFFKLRDYLPNLAFRP
jgi:hypothetical protein